MRSAIPLLVVCGTVLAGCGSGERVLFKGEVEYFTYKASGGAYRTVSATADVQNLEVLAETGRKASISARTAIFLEIGEVWTDVRIVDENGGVHRFVLKSEVLVEYRAKTS
jgi:hypothetical protein